MASEWTDKRLDDLKATVDDLKGTVDDGFKAVNGRIDRLQHAMNLAVVAICTMMFAGFGALITLFATHF